MPSETTTACVRLLVFFRIRRGTFPYGVEDDASTISLTPTTHYTNTRVKLTIVTHLSFSERIAIANLSFSSGSLKLRHGHASARTCATTVTQGLCGVSRSLDTTSLQRSAKHTFLAPRPLMNYQFSRAAVHTFFGPRSLNTLAQICTHFCPRAGV